MVSFMAIMVVLVAVEHMVVLVELERLVKDTLAELVIQVALSLQVAVEEQEEQVLLDHLPLEETEELEFKTA